MAEDFELVPPTKRAKKSAAKTDGSTQRLMDLFQKCHQDRHGVPALLGTTYAHAMKIFKDLKDQVGEDGAAQLVEAFFFARDARVESSGFTVKDLMFHAPRLRLNLTGRPKYDKVLASHVELAARLRQK